MIYGPCPQKSTISDVASEVMKEIELEIAYMSLSMSSATPIVDGWLPLYETAPCHGQSRSTPQDVALETSRS
jgi:hypothetical protein